jgi:hypothetical protein
MKPRVPAIAYAFCACLLLVLGALAFPVMDGIASTPAGATGITATAGGAVGQTTFHIGATWGSIPTTLTTGTPPAGALVQTFSTVLGNPAPQNFFSYNSGTVNLVATTYTVTVTTSGLVIGTPSATLKTCTVTWTTSCTGGTSTTINTWTGTGGSPTAIAVVPAAPGARLSIQTSITGILLAAGGNVIVTINTGVNSLTPRQIRAATITNA